MFLSLPLFTSGILARMQEASLRRQVRTPAIPCLLCRALPDDLQNYCCPSPEDTHQPINNSIMCLVSLKPMQNFKKLSDQIKVRNNETSGAPALLHGSFLAHWVFSDAQ